MNLSLDHQDIVNAIEAHVANQGIQVTGKTMATTITCGRGPNGVSAIVELIKANSIAAGPEQNALVPEPAPESKPKTRKKSEPAPELVVSSVFDEAPVVENLEDPAIDESVGGGLFDD